jgi:adenylate cyclase
MRSFESIYMLQIEWSKRMYDDLVRRELQTLEWSQALLAQLNPSVDAEDFKKLTDAYDLLIRNHKRIIRISDMNEARLHKVSEELTQEKHKLERLAQQLSGYLPRQVYDSIFSGQQSSEIQTKRKRLTIFFSDIKGFTSISESLQPERLTYYINQYFSEMSRIATSHGGTIDKFIGDAMMVFFGDPQSRGASEDARAAVAMAVAMQRRLAQLNKIWQAEGLEYPLITRMGANTGYCNVGNFGSQDRVAYTLLGAEVNVAARLQSAAEPGGLLISYPTYALVRDYVHATECEPLTLKGITRPVRNFSVHAYHCDGHHESAPLELSVPGAGRVSINPAHLSMPERDRLILELRALTEQLERGAGEG